MHFHLNSTAMTAVVLGSALALGAVQARTAQAGCKDLPSHARPQGGARSLPTPRLTSRSITRCGATIVAEDGTVCAVAHTGADNLQSQWLASRVISAQKANTANSLSLGQNDGGTNAGLALSTANLWAAVQPGGSLFGLQHSNPVDPAVAYKGPSSKFGKSNDPMVGKLIGGVNVFGGGLALYNEAGDRVGGVGVSGDTSCRDHMVAWETRHNLGLDHRDRRRQRRCGRDPTTSSSMSRMPSGIRTA